MPALTTMATYELASRGMRDRTWCMLDSSFLFITPPIQRVMLPDRLEQQSLVQRTGAQARLTGFRRGRSCWRPQRW